MGKRWALTWRRHLLDGNLGVLEDQLDPAGSARHMAKAGAAPAAGAAAAAAGAAAADAPGSFDFSLSDSFLAIL